MKFRNYCIIVFGNLVNITEDIMSLSDSETHVFTPDGGGCCIITFTSSQTIDELREFFIMTERNFLLYELSIRTSAQHFVSEEIREGLFGFIRNSNLSTKTQKLMEEIRRTRDKTETIKNTTERPITKKASDTKAFRFTDDNISKMNDEEKNSLFDSILAKGPKNLTELDKEILTKLSK